MKKNVWAILLISAAVILIAVGVMLGQPGEVLRKAVRICMECVGLG